MVELLVNYGWFRNANHAIWFLCSLGMFAIVVLQFVVLQFVLPRKSCLPAIVGTIVHLPPLVTSSITVLIQQRRSEIYSTDCILFNSVMFVAYLALSVALASRRLRNSANGERSREMRSPSAVDVPGSMIRTAAPNLMRSRTASR